MPRRKVTRAAKSRKTSRVSDGNDLEISNKAEREKLETYLKDFDTRGKGFQSIHKDLLCCLSAIGFQNAFGDLFLSDCLFFELK